MPAVAGLQGPVPGTGALLIEAGRELRAKDPSDLVRCLLGVGMFEHERVAAAGVLAGQRRQLLASLRLRVGAAFVRCEEQMVEGHQRRRSETLPVPCEPGFDLTGGGLAQ
ncbi:hypothetical protein D9M70_610610 [compost metagenome]